MNYLNLNSNDFFLTNDVQDVTSCGLPSWSNFYREKGNLSSWKYMHMYANIKEYLNMTSIENLKIYS